MGRAFNRSEQTFLKTLFEIGAFEEHIKVGKKLAGHQKHPTAPLSTFYFNLRDSFNPKSGPLKEAHLRSIGTELLNLAIKKKIAFDAIAGIPNAGTPISIAFADAFHAAKATTTKTIQLTKSLGVRGQTLIQVPKHYRPRSHDGSRMRVLLLDDLVSGAETKWLAINALRRAGYEVAALVVFIDREQGGAHQLRMSGITVESVFQVNDIIDFYEEKKLISRANARLHREYIARRS